MATRKSRIVVTGDKAIDKALRELAPKVGKRIARDAMRRELKPLLAEIKAKLPVGETGQLADSGKIRGAGRRGSVGVGIVFNSDHVAAVELGTTHQEAQAPIRSTFDGKADGMSGRVLAEIGAEVVREFNNG